jgi:hypothetical protein
MSAHRTADFTRFAARGWLVALVVLTVAPWLSADVAAQPSKRANSTVENAPLASTNPAETERKRAREGTKIEKTGYFRKTGDRVTFYTDDGKTRYRGLENLMLERIVRQIEDSPGQLEWHVTAVLTEYRGANFLLVTYAVLKTSGPRSQVGPLTRPGEQ